MTEMEKIKMLLSSNIKKARDINGLSQMALAERSGLSVQMIRDVEAGRRWPSAATIEAIAKGLGVAVGVLFNEDQSLYIKMVEAEKSLRLLGEALGFSVVKKD